MDKPYIKTDPLYRLLRDEDIKAFNEQRDQIDTSELKSGDYRGRDLRNMNAEGLDFSTVLVAGGTYDVVVLPSSDMVMLPTEASAPAIRRLPPMYMELQIEDGGLMLGCK